MFFQIYYGYRQPLESLDGPGSGKLQAGTWDAPALGSFQDLMLHSVLFLSSLGNPRSLYGHPFDHISVV